MILTLHQPVKLRYSNARVAWIFIFIFLCFAFPPGFLNQPGPLWFLHSHFPFCRLLQRVPYLHTKFFPLS